MTPGLLGDSVLRVFLDVDAATDSNAIAQRLRVMELAQEIAEEFHDHADWPYAAKTDTIVTSTSVAYASLPADFGTITETGGVYIESQINPLVRLEPNLLWKRFQYNSGAGAGTGKPQAYAIIGNVGSGTFRNRIQFDRTPDAVYTITLHYKITCPLVLDRPTAATAALAGLGAGNVDTGTHSYVVTFVGEDASESESGVISNVVSSISGSNGQIALTGIPLGSTAVVSRKLYRTSANGSSYKLLATISDNTTTTYADNLADSTLGAVAPGVVSSFQIIPKDYHRSVILKGVIAGLARVRGDGRAQEFDALYRRELGRAKSRHQEGLEDDQRIGEDGYASYRNW